MCPTCSSLVAAALARVVREVSLGEGAPDLVLGASVGVAGFGGESVPTVEQLLADADGAMYVAKRAAREERP